MEINTTFRVLVGHPSFNAYVATSCFQDCLKIGEIFKVINQEERGGNNKDLREEEEE
ncbi:hypothetical protein YC2023_035280 [Brassica napus]